MQDERPSRLFLALAFAGALLVFGWAYARSFQVLPASDDWPIVVEMHRGNQEGVHKFFTDSVIRIGYRPLKSVVIWAFGNLGDTDQQRFAWIRLAHLLAALGYAGVAVLWVRAMPIGKIGAVTLIALMLLHPVLPQAAGSVDGIDTLASSALLWLGAWCIFRYRDRPPRAIVMSVLCFFVGIGFKENLFALVPLSMIVVLMFWRKQPWRDVGIVGLSFAIAAAAMILLRFAVIRGGLSAGQAMIRFNPLQIAENAALFAAALLLFGNSMWVYVSRAPAVLALAAAGCLVAFGMIASGIMLKLRGQEIVTDGSQSPLRWVIFLLLGITTASFPAILLYKVSEMYVPPMLLPFALLCGMAADGFRRASLPIQVLAAGLAGIALVFSLITIRSKIDGLVDVGQRAQRQLEQIISYLPADARDMTVVIRFLESDRRPGDLYAVFRMPDSMLLVHRNVLDWRRPYRGLVLDADTVQDFSHIDPSQFDVALGWDAEQQRFFPLNQQNR